MVEHGYHEGNFGDGPSDLRAVSELWGAVAIHNWSADGLDPQASADGFPHGFDAHTRALGEVHKRALTGMGLTLVRESPLRETPQPNGHAAPHATGFRLEEPARFADFLGRLQPEGMEDGAAEAVNLIAGNVMDTILGEIRTGAVVVQEADSLERIGYGLENLGQAHTADYYNSLARYSRQGLAIVFALADELGILAPPGHDDREALEWLQGDSPDAEQNQRTLRRVLLGASAHAETSDLYGRLRRNLDAIFRTVMSTSHADD